MLDSDLVLLLRQYYINDAGCAYEITCGHRQLQDPVISPTIFSGKFHAQCRCDSITME